MAVSEQARVELPSYAQDKLEVFVNGVPQVEGRDYRREGTALVFDRSLAKEGKLGAIRWLSMLLGVAGTYRPNDTVDVAYEYDGKPGVAANLPVTSIQS
jgi:hypothetical protein